LVLKGFEFENIGNPIAYTGIEERERKGKRESERSPFIPKTVVVALLMSTAGLTDSHLVRG
jgi:hypothetical protein